MSNVVIDIAAQFTGKPAFKKADTAVSQLNKGTQNLGKTLTRTFGTAAVLAFGRASVKAFAEDNKAATSLGQTLKNLDLAYGSNIGTVNGYISRLEAQTGVLDDELRPAMDRLLRATGSVTKSQDLLNLALDIAAGTGKSVTQVSQSLQKAYLGQTQALGRLGVGLTKAELTSSSFEEIQQRLTALFAGQATAAAETFAGKLDKLTIAANNAKETIGAGLVDALTALSGGDTSTGIQNIDKLATGIASSVKNVGLLIDKLDKLKPVLIAVGLVAAAAFLPVTTAIAGAIFLLGDLNKRLDEQSFRKGVIPNGMGKISMTVSGQVDNRVLKNQTTVTKLTKEQAAAQAKILRDKRLGIAIDKANLLLGKGADVFDLDKIQNQAALINQAELLGKATNASQILQITNDTARLNVKKAISDLEDAIASKDEASIIAATKKLNAELAILNAVSRQNIKLLDIKTVLDSLKAKDLINLDNLNAAIGLLTRIGTMGIAGSTTNSITTDAAAQATAILAAKTEAEKKAAEAAKAAAEAAKAALEAANADAASAAAKAKAAADAALAAAQALTAEEKAKAEAAAGASTAAIATAAVLAAEEKARAAAAAEAAAAEIARLEAAKKAAEETAAALQELAEAAAAAADAAAILGGNNAADAATGATVQVPTIFAKGQRIDSAGNLIGFNPEQAAAGMTSGNGSTQKVEITVVAPAFTDPNAVAEVINNYLKEAQQRGTLTVI